MLGGNVLVLNRLWQAVHITTARCAVILLYSGRAKALDADYTSYDWDAWVARPPLDTGAGEDYVQGVNARFVVPRIVQLVRFDRVPRTRVKFTRANIYLRDRYRCQYCGRKGKKSELNIDHMVPRSRGGGSTWENVVVACIPCNRRKANRLPEEIGMFPQRRPTRPRWHPALTPTGEAAPHPQWRPFLEAAYWPGDRR
ncbi:MAG: HNH endonuclease [Acidobacteriota bacterium]|jgi:5-methylcytosine-specific restriction endonuclease McrA